MPIRLVDAGTVSSLRSQTIYHGVAYAFTEETPNTIILATPEEPYLGLGFHQKLNKEIDVEYCLKHHIPIVRREVGGGAVYLDQNQLFTQWVFQPDALPMRIVERFRLHAYPIIATYQALGIDASFRPVNDIQVVGRKIAGLGAAAMGQAEVVVGNFMFDFNYELMANTLNVSDEKFRKTLYQSLQTYMTTMREELDIIPDRETVKMLYKEQCETILKEPLEEGSLTDAEWQMMEKLDAKFSSEEWLHAQGSHIRPAIKIHCGVWLGELHFKNNGSAIRAIIRIKDNHVDALEVFGATNKSSPQFAHLEKSVLSTEISADTLFPKFKQFYEEEGIQTPEIAPEDWVAAIVSLAEAVQKY